MGTATQEKILTPEEAYKAAYDRITSIGDAIIAQWPEIKYNTNTLYKFSYDKNSQYKWLNKCVLGMKYDVFERLSDGGFLHLTKYGERPIEI